MRPWKHAVLGAVFVLLSLVAGTAYSAPYNLRDLGPGLARDVNNAGQIIVTGHGAVLWSEQSGFVTLPMTYAKRLNDKGLVMGEIAGGSVVWDTLTHMITTYDDLFIDDINNSGEIAGMSIEQAHWKETCYQDKTGSRTYMGNRTANAINNHGVIAGEGIWTKATGWSALPGTGFAINDPNQVVGELQSKPHAFVWSQSTGTTDIGALLPDATSSTAIGINNRGDVVGGWEDAFQRSHGFFWNPTTGIVNLDSLLEGGECCAYAINDQGQIVGVSDGHAVLWQPVPEPSSLAALGGGVMGLLALRRRRR